MGPQVPRGIIAEPSTTNDCEIMGTWLVHGLGGGTNFSHEAKDVTDAFFRKF